MKSVSYSGAVRTALSVAVLSALVACGGGGSDSPSASTVTVSGVAAKGLLKNAIVKAYRINADGSRTQLNPNTSVKTNTDGTYSLAGIPAGVTVLVEITAGPDTTMVDEATNEPNLPVPLNFVMRAAVTTVEGGANTLQVTPFSEMAVAKAEAAEGGLSSSNIESANADIRSYLGFDVLAEKPEFNTGTDAGTVPKNKAALMLAAVSRLAESDTITECAGEDTQAAKVACVVDKMAEDGTENSDLADKIEAAKDDVLEDDFDGGDDQIPAPPQVQPPVLVAPEVGTTIGAAKALIASVRANEPLLGGTAGDDTLTKRLKAVQDVLSSAANPLGDSSRELYRGVVQASNHLGAVNADNFVQGPFEVSVDMAWWGYCTYFQADGTTEATSASNVNMIGCRITYGVESKTVGDVTSNYAYQHAFRVVKGSSLTAPFAVRSVTVEQKLNDDYSSDTSSADNTVYLSGTYDTPNMGAIAVTRNDSGVFTAFSLSGDYAVGINAAINGYSAKNTVTATLTPSTVGELTRLSIVGSFAASGGSKPAGTVSVSAGSYLETKFSVPGNIESNEVGRDKRTAHLILSGSVGDASITGTLNVTGSTASKDATPTVQPTSVSFQGVVKQTAAITLFDGTMTATIANFGDFYVTEQAESSSNFLRQTATFTGALYVPTRPLLNVSLTLRSSPTTYHTDTLSGQYSQEGGPTVLLDGVKVKGNDAASSLTLTNTTGGITFVIKPNEELSYLKKNDVVIGTFNRSNSRIDYADGSYEQY